MVASARGSLRVMELLLRYGALLGTKDAFGQTAESFAVIFNQKQSRRTIIQYNWRRRNEQSLIQERQARSIMSHQSSEIDKAMEEANRQRQARVAILVEQRKKRQEHIISQQSCLRKKKSKLICRFNF